jgi:hypothetical protein
VFLLVIGRSSNKKKERSSEIQYAKIIEQREEENRSVCLSHNTVVCVCLPAGICQNIEW